MNEQRSLPSSIPMTVMPLSKAPPDVCVHYSLLLMCVHKHGGVKCRGQIQSMGYLHIKPRHVQ